MQAIVERPCWIYGKDYAVTSQANAVIGPGYAKQVKSAAYPHILR